MVHIPVAPPPLQFPANIPWKPAEDGQSAWTSVPTQKTLEAPALDWTGPALDILTIWGNELVNRRLINLFLFLPPSLLPSSLPPPSLPSTRVCVCVCSTFKIIKS